jgi:hypothetical protein
VDHGIGFFRPGPQAVRVFPAQPCSHGCDQKIQTSLKRGFVFQIISTTGFYEQHFWHKKNQREADRFSCLPNGA